MHYSIKNLHIVFTKQRLLSLLLVLNIIISCLVICFSYGLYQNYNAVIKEGEQQEYKTLNIFHALSKNDTPQNEYGWREAFITIGQIRAMFESFSDELAENIEYASFLCGIQNDLFLLRKYPDKEYESADQIEYEDHGCYIDYAAFGVKGGKLIPTGRLADYISEDDYAAGKKCIVVGNEMYDPKISVGNNGLTEAHKLTADDKYITVEGEQFEVIRGNGNFEGSIYFPVTALPDSLKPWISSMGRVVDINFFSPITSSQYKEICEAAKELLGDSVYVEELQFTEAEEIYYYRTVLLISIVIALLAAVNMAILYRFILERRARELAVMRICGCTRAKAEAMYLLECMLVILPLFALTEFLWDKLLKDRIAPLFDHFENAYSFKLYAVIFGIYAVSSAAVMYAMISLTVKRHSLIEMKTGSASRSFKLFKALETVQLTAVLVLMTVLCSAVMSRYSLYDHFSDLLQSKGYLVNYTGSFLRDNEFRELFPGAEVITTDWNAFDIDTGKEELAHYRCIEYTPDLIGRFVPLLSDGEWIGVSEHSYKKDSLIPAIVDSGSSFSVGDILTAPEVMIEWDENYQPTRSEDLKFIIVGKLENMASVVSYPYIAGKPVDYRSIYGVFNSDFIDENVLLIRESDITELYGMASPIMGIQFIRCSGMNDEELKAVKDALTSLGTTDVSYTRLEDADEASRSYIFEQMKTIFPIALCIFILTVISSISISAIYTKRHLHTYAVLYICGATWRSCALRSLRAGLITCGVAAALTAAILGIGKLTFMKDTVVTFGLIPLAVCAGVLLLYVALSMIMPLLIIGKTEPREVLKEE